MKIRNILYGYCYENGKIVFHPTESEIMKEIVRKYRSGDSLLEIAKGLNNRMVEYMAGVCGWNKSRIMRLLEDRRYLGDDKYPALISEEDYNDIQKKREEKNTQKDVDRGADIFQMPIPIRCTKCNAQMRRVVNKRAIIPIRWMCQSHTCKTAIGKKDENMCADLMGLLNEVIENPEQVIIPQEKEIETSIEARRLNNEITRMFDSKLIDGEAVRTKMITYASLKYAELDNSVIKAQRLKDIFTAILPLQTFSLELLERTVDEIKMYADGTLGIVLENGQEIKQEVENADSNSGTA